MYEEQAGLLACFLNAVGWLYGTSPVHQGMIQFTILQIGEHIPDDPMEAAHVWIRYSNLLHTVIVPGIKAIHKEYVYERKES